MKRLIAVILSVILLVPAVSAGASGPPALSAACAILVDGESGRVLFSKNAHEERSIASITKLMTALVAVEHAQSLETEVVIRPEWAGIEGSSIYLKPGEVVTLKTLLYGLMLNSGNDAAIAIAGYCGGDLETFVGWMNDRAAELGMKHTCFTNPNGLTEEGHYSTAYDMALLAQECSKNDVIAEIVATRSITLGTRTFINHNKLLWRYEGCTGMKTGYTEKAGRTLVSSAQRNGQTLIAVTLHAPNDWSDHAALFDYGFGSFPRRMLCRGGKVIGRVPVQGGLVPGVSVMTAEDVFYPLQAEEIVCARIELSEFAAAPVEKGSVLGTLTFFRDDRVIGKTDLVASSAVHRNLVQPQGILNRVIDFLCGE